jgi:hypothetical protein
MSNAKYVNEIVVVDPDDGEDVTIAIYKHEGGGMFGIDSSFIDQVLDDENDVIPDPFSYMSDVQGLFLNDH